jgi:hypothetical protein
MQTRESDTINSLLAAYVNQLDLIYKYFFINQEQYDLYIIYYLIFYLKSKVGFIKSIFIEIKRIGI